MERLETITRQLTYKDLEKKPLKVTVTGAAGNIGYALVFMIGQGRMFGLNQPVDITLLELPTGEAALRGVIMEINDCSLPLVRSVKGVTDVKDAFVGCDVAILVGARPRGPGMERKDLLSANSKIFEVQGKAINSYASRNCKVLVVGNPANTNALIAMLNAPDIPKENFTALTRLDHNRANSQLSDRIKTGVENIRNVIIWGNHSATQVPDVNHAHVVDPKNTKTKKSVKSLVNDDAWLKGEFMSIVQKRGAAIIAARKLSSAASAANAVCDHMYDWFVGTPEGEWVSMAVRSDGSYGVPKDLIFSFPVSCSNGTYKIVQNLSWDDNIRKKIEETTKELQEEKALALGQ